MVRTTNGPAPTCRSTRTRRFLVRSCLPAMAPSWRSPRSGAFIIGTNGARPERSSRLIAHVPREATLCVGGELYVVGRVGIHEVIAREPDVLTSIDKRI